MDSQDVNYLNHIASKFDSIIRLPYKKINITSWLFKIRT